MRDKEEQQSKPRSGLSDSEGAWRRNREREWRAGKKTKEQSEWATGRGWQR